MGENEVQPLKSMRLRYAGHCRECGLALPAGTTAVYDRESKTVICQECSTFSESPAQVREQMVGDTEAASTSAPKADVASEVFRGVAGASARRENERRKAKREDRVRNAHPVIGGFLLAMTDDPQSTRAWATGARGEELLGQRLDGLAGRGLHVLHDRRVGSRANIDHIAVGPSGVFVIDAKRYKEKRPSLRVEGGIIRARTEKLMVGSRDRTSLVDGVLHQVVAVESALMKAGIGATPVRGMLCFVEADWPIIGGSFTVAGVDVLWPKKAADVMLKPGVLDDASAKSIHRVLASAFPPA